VITVDLEYLEKRRVEGIAGVEEVAQPSEQLGYRRAYLADHLEEGFAVALRRPLGPDVVVNREVRNQDLFGKLDEELLVLVVVNGVLAVDLGQ